MLSLPLRGDIVKFAANFQWLASDSGPGSGPSAGSNCASTGYFSAPQMYIAVYLLTIPKGYQYEGVEPPDRRVPDPRGHFVLFEVFINTY